jgi:glucose-6-phosphate isomerase
MIKTDTSIARKFIDRLDYENAFDKAEAAIFSVREKTGEGTEWMGWRHILKNPNDAILEQIESHAESIRKEADVFIVCGIGGSYLGAKAVIDALSPHFGKTGPEIIFTGHHMGGRYLEQLITYLSQPKTTGESKSVFMNVISKSGSTLETALSFRILRKWMEDTYADDADRRITCTTSAEGGILNKLIEEKGYTKFIIPDDIGGRFSVLTPVGLLPISVAGHDIKALFYGAVGAYRHYRQDAGDIVDYAAIRYAVHESGKTIDLFTSFEPELTSFGGWIQQLLGESEGKKDKGIFPSVAAFSTDLHSLGQFVQQGKRSLIETCLIVEKPFSGLEVPGLDDDTDQLNYLQGMTFHEINSRARQGTIEAHQQGGVPVIQIMIPALNEQHLGELIYFYELFTAVYVYCLEINPFNQPGVEDYKKAMYRLLGKN